MNKQALVGFETKHLDLDLQFEIWDQDMIPLFICVFFFILSFILAHFWPSVTFSRFRSTYFGLCVRWGLSSGCVLLYSLEPAMTESG